MPLVPSSSADLHIICERDVGLFSLIQQVIANIPWAHSEGRTPIAYFGERTCYWTPRGYRGSDTVWEYYFEPLIIDHAASTIPQSIKQIISRRHPSPSDPGYQAGRHAFVSCHFGDHPDLDGKTLLIPYRMNDPDHSLREEASPIIQRYVRPRPYIMEKTEEFFEQRMNGSYIIGAHVRGTDAVSSQEIRWHRQGSLSLPAFSEQLAALLKQEPDARILVATDAQCSLNYLTEVFGSRIIAYESIRHEYGEAAGAGPTGSIMPAYIAADRDKAARNGEEAVIEYLLLSRCNVLVHNGSSLARTVLLKEPGIVHFNTHQGP